jgi:hypothetical protein
MGCDVPLLAMAWSVLGRTVGKATVRCSRVLVSGVPACPMGIEKKFYSPLVMFEGRDEGGVLLGFLHAFLVASEVSE